MTRNKKAEEAKALSWQGATRQSVTRLWTASTWHFIILRQGFTFFLTSRLRVTRLPTSTSISMAEIVGLVSGAITLADASHKAGSGILALRRLWNDVHDVPHYINSLLDRLSLVHSVLADLKDQLSRDQNITPTNSAIQLSVQYCDKAIQNLDTLVNELKQNVEDKARLRRNKARIKVVFERDVIQRLERGLQDALQLLGIAQQTYTV